MGSHLIDGEFQSDKYPTCPRGKVPLSVKDMAAQDLLWEYAQRRSEVDLEFSNDLKLALQNAGYVPPGDPAVGLSRRERQVFEALARGFTNREIAKNLDISTKTIDTHRAQVLKKLGLRNNSELTRFAIKHRYVAP